MSGAPLVSVVVPCFGTPPERLARLCRSLLAQEHRDFELIVADEGSPGLKGALPADGRFGWLDCRGSRGPGAARNLGAARASGELLFFTDSDCELAPSTLAAVARGLGSGAEIQAGNTVTRPATAFGRAVALLGFPGGGSLGFDRVWRVDARGLTHSVSGCNFAIKRSVFEDVGRFPAIPVAGGEDTVLSRIALEKGHAIHYAVEQLVFHEGRESLASFVRWQITRGRGSFHIARRLGTLSRFLKLRLWSFKNSVSAAGLLYAPFVVLLWVLLVCLQALGYELERARTAGS
jgi:glycosyltransferase involved in cell wall biosynthesis